MIKQSVLLVIMGVLLGNFVAMRHSLLSLGLILSTSATAFIKCFGIFYLIYLGIKV